MSSPICFYIVRHGNTFDAGDVLRRVGGRTDLPLSVSGQTQADQLADAFSDVQFSAAFSSDLKRTKQTCLSILSRATDAPDLRVAPFLREIDYGPDEGKPETEVIARLGQDALAAWDTDAIAPRDWRVDPDAVRANWEKFLSKPHSGNVLVVTSNGIARFILDVCQNSDDHPRKLRTGAYGIIEMMPDGPVIESWDARP